MSIVLWLSLLNWNMFKKINVKKYGSPSKVFGPEGSKDPKECYFFFDETRTAILNGRVLSYDDFDGVSKHQDNVNWTIYLMIQLKDGSRVTMDLPYLHSDQANDAFRFVSNLINK